MSIAESIDSGDRILTNAAVMRGTGREWEVVELRLDPPKDHEVLIRYVASGLCHSDEHLRTDGFWGGMARFPMVGGHEGAGIVEAVGPGVTTAKVGDHVVCSFIPACGRCRWCSTGHQNLCDLGADVMQGCLPDGTFRFHDSEGDDYGGLCMLGTFSQYGVVSEYSVVAIDPSLPLEVAVIVGCGVPTGWGSAVYRAEVGAGDTVVVYGVGGVGINAVQGAKYAGAAHVIAVDPIEFKRESALKLGATHAAANAAEAHELVQQLTAGVGADSAIITMGVTDTATVTVAYEVIRKAGSVTITGLAAMNDNTIQLPSGMVTLFEKKIQGALFGGCNPVYDIPKLLGLYQQGDLKLEELITRRYKLEDINQGYEDLLSGKNIRGIILHSDCRQ
jgi:NDMA-dependent alcohol dehydrogenase